MCSSHCTCVPVGAEPGGDGIWQSKAVEMRPCRLCFRLVAPAPLGCLMPQLNCPPAILPLRLSLSQLFQPSGTGKPLNRSKVGWPQEATLSWGLCYLGNNSPVGLAPKGELLLMTGIKHPLHVRASACTRGCSRLAWDEAQRGIAVCSGWCCSPNPCMASGTALGTLGTGLGISVAQVGTRRICMERAGCRRSTGETQVPRFDLHMGVVSHRCVCVCMPVYLHRCFNVCALPGRQSRAGASLSSVCTCVCSAELNRWCWPCPCCACCCFLLCVHWVKVGCEQRCALLQCTLGCSCPAQPGWGVPSWGRHCFTSGCERCSWLSSACQCLGETSPQGCVGTSGAENRGGEHPLDLS